LDEQPAMPPMQSTLGEHPPPSLQLSAPLAPPLLEVHAAATTDSIAAANTARIIVRMRRFLEHVACPTDVRESERRSPRAPVPYRAGS
jgi:hypothetical protein